MHGKGWTTELLTDDVIALGTHQPTAERAVEKLVGALTEVSAAWLRAAGWALTARRKGLPFLLERRE